MDKPDSPPHNMNQEWKKRLFPFVLSVCIIAADQITKFLVVASIPAWSVGYDFFNGAFRIIHVYNPGAAFSLGSEMPGFLRSVILGLVPSLVIVIILAVYFRHKEFSQLQRWCIAGIVGGGIGNLIDRFLRPDGVVDFIDVAVYGFLGFERWPTFNIADSAIVVSGIILIASFLKNFLAEIKKSKTAEKEGGAHE